MIEYRFGYMDENTVCPRETALPNPGKAVPLYLHTAKRIALISPGADDRKELYRLFRFADPEVQWVMLTTFRT